MQRQPKSRSERASDDISDTTYSSTGSGIGGRIRNSCRNSSDSRNYYTLESCTMCIVRRVMEHSYLYSHRPIQETNVHRLHHTQWLLPPNWVQVRCNMLLAQQNEQLSHDRMDKERLYITSYTVKDIIHPLWNQYPEARTRNVEWEKITGLGSRTSEKKPSLKRY